MRDQTRDAWQHYSCGGVPHLSCKLKCEGHIDDVLLHCGLLLLLGSLDVLTADVPNVASNVQEGNGGDLQQNSGS